MQSVKIGKLLRQLAVLISRNFQLIWNQKLTLCLLYTSDAADE